jgi:hypothetical protein
MPSRYAIASSSLVDGSRTSSCPAKRKSSRSARASMDAPLRGSPSRYRNYSREEGPGGSLRAFARDDVGASPQPLSAPLQAGIRFLRLPLPATPVSLHYGWPARTAGEVTGLPCSARITGRIRSCLSAGRITVRVLRAATKATFSVPFWPEPKLSPAGSFKPNDVYQQFTYVDRTSQAWLPSGARLHHRHLTSRFGLAFRRASLSRQLRTRPLPATHVSVGYR